MRFYLHVLKSIAILAGGFVVGCGSEIKGDDKAAGAPIAGSIVTLDQGWSADIQQRFWFTDQGSQILPYSWFLALEQAGSQLSFRADANIERLGYFPERPSKYNPDGLWNGSAPNAGIGPLLRNIGEVLGVFGNVTVTGSPLPKGFK